MLRGSPCARLYLESGSFSLDDADLSASALGSALMSDFRSNGSRAYVDCPRL